MTNESNDFIQDLKLFSPEMLADPYSVYRKMRARHPVLWIPALEAWALTSYQVVTAGLRDPQLSSDRFGRVRQRIAKKGLDHLVDDRLRSMLHMDPPGHTRIRSLVSKAFTPRAVDAMEGRIQRMVEELLDAAQPAGGMDVIGDLAYPLPVMVIAEMLGVPPEDRDRFKSWSDEIS